MNRFTNYILMFLKFSDDEQPPGGQQKKSSFKYLPAKILAVLMAVGLWLHVMNEQNPPIEARYAVPLEVRNIPANYVLVEQPGNVRVKIRGPRILVAGTTSKDIKAYVSMTGMSEGRHNMSINSVIPPSLELVENIPETTVVHLEPIITRTLPVTVEFSGNLPGSLSITKVNSKLSQATVKGPKHLIDAVDKLVGTVDVSGKKESFSADTVLTPIGRNGLVVEGLTVSPESTTVEIKIETIVLKKTVDIRPVYTGKLPAGLSIKEITFDLEKIEIKDETGANKATLEKIDHISTEPIRLAEITHDTRKVIKLNLPEGITSETTSIVANIHLNRE